MLVQLCVFEEGLSVMLEELLPQRFVDMGTYSLLRQAIRNGSLLVNLYIMLPSGNKTVSFTVLYYDVRIISVFSCIQQKLYLYKAVVTHSLQHANIYKSVGIWRTWKTYSGKLVFGLLPRASTRWFLERN